MLQALSDIVKNVAIIILLTTFLDMLLPNNNMQRFIKVVMGLFVMLAILNPIISLLDKDLELSAWQLSVPTEQEVDTVLVNGKKLNDLTQTQALDEYKGRIAQQMEALVKLIPEVGEVKCAVTISPSDKIGSIGEIKKTTIWVSLEEKNTSTNIEEVEPVRVEIGNNGKKRHKEGEVKTDDQVKKKIINIITNYYSLEKNMLEVIFY